MRMFVDTRGLRAGRELFFGAAARYRGCFGLLSNDTSLSKPLSCCREWLVALVGRRRGFGLRLRPAFPVHSLVKNLAGNRHDASVDSSPRRPQVARGSPKNSSPRRVSAGVST